MEFYYELKFKIKNEEVRELDHERARLNRLVSITYDERQGDPFICFNRKTPRLARSAGRKSMKRVKELEQEDLPDFDRIVLKDIRRNIEIVSNYLEYKYDPNSKMRVGKFVSRVFGNGSYTELIDSVSPNSFPHDAIHRYRNLTHDLYTGAMMSSFMLGDNQENPYFKNLRKRMLAQLNECRKFVNSFFTDNGVLRELSDYHFQFSPLGDGFSFWDGGNLLAAIDPDRAVCFRPRGKSENTFLDVLIDMIGIHELGHGLTELLSRKTMPRGFNPCNPEYLTFVHGTTSEGTALALEDISLDYMTEHSQELGLSRRELAIGRAFSEVYVPLKLPHIVHDVFERRQTEETHNKDYPQHITDYAHKRLVEKTGIKPYLDWYLFLDREIFEAVDQMIYFFGQKRTKELIEKMRRKKIPKDIILHALLSTGLWCDHQAREEFIFDIYVPKAMEIREKQVRMQKRRKERVVKSPSP